MKGRVAHVEPFNGCREMLPINEPSNATTPHGPSRVVLTARLARDSIFMCSIKIPLLRERPPSEAPVRDCTFTARGDES